MGWDGGLAGSRDGRGWGGIIFGVGTGVGTGQLLTIRLGGARITFVIILGWWYLVLV